jgi:hypothetical protein
MNVPAPVSIDPGPDELATIYRPNILRTNTNGAGMRVGWNAAAAADAPLSRTQRFHRAYCGNVHRAFLAGRMADGRAIGGPYLTTCIDGEGAWLEGWTLPGEPAELKAA